MTFEDLKERNYEAILDLEWVSRVHPELFTVWDLETLKKIIKNIEDDKLKKQGRN